MAAIGEALFGDAGRRLPAQALARFVVLAGSAPAALEHLLSGEGDAQTPNFDLMPLAQPWLRIDLDQAIAMGAQLAAVSDVADFCTRLNRCWDLAVNPALGRGQLCGGPPQIDTLWLTRLLVEQAPMEAVVFEHPQWGAAAIDWPLRVGLPPSPAGTALAGDLQTGWLRELYEPVIERGTTPVDLLLFPGPLSQALRSARSTRQRRASLVVVLGPTDLSGGLPALRELAHHWEAATVVACGLAAPSWSQWLKELVAAMSHNQPIPLAVFEAQRRVSPDPNALLPVVLSDLEFAEHNRPLDVAHRLAEALRRQATDLPMDALPELAPAIGPDAGSPANEVIARALDTSADQWPWSSESQGATRLVRTRRALEQQLRGPINLRHRPPMEAAMVDMAPRDAGAMPPEPIPDTTAPRHVKFDLWPLATVAPRHTPPPMAPHTEHRLEVFIAPASAQAHATAEVPLDERQLPPSADGHELTIVLCPLSPIGNTGETTHIPPPSMATLHLPPSGTSTRATFVLTCGASAADFRARLIVLHQQRVLQSLLLLPNEGGYLMLSVENRYAPGFDSPSADVPADLAFLVNDNPDGASGLTTMTPERASFLAPDGMKESITQMRRLLNAAVQAEAGAGEQALDRPALLDLMLQLANHGAVIVEELALQHPLQQLDAATRIQVVEAVDQAYFPAEFLYSGPAPEPGAALCPNAGAALADNTNQLHDQCPHRDDEGHVCPVSFWGFRKCIERHAPNGDSAIVVSVPTLGQERLGPFTSALLAASDRAQAEMTGPAGLPTTMAERVNDVTTVTTWADWKKQVMARPRDLLLLMPHSDKSSVIAGMPSLEVSRDELAASNLSEKYVRNGDLRGPLVLLLGCSTSFADLPFLNFVRRFHLKGAPAVVGTLSVVHASQARHLAQRLLDLAMAPASQAMRLDEAMLRLRRELLAEGNGVSFTLMAYGHSAWRL